MARKQRIPPHLFEPAHLRAVIPVLLLNLLTIGPAILVVYLLVSTCSGPALPPDIP